MIRITNYGQGQALIAQMLRNQEGLAVQQERVSTGKQAAAERTREEYGYTLADWDNHKDAIGALTLKQIMSATGLAVTAASRIKTGKQIPHPRLWEPLFEASSRVGRGRD